MTRIEKSVEFTVYEKPDKMKKYTISPEYKMEFVQIKCFKFICQKKRIKSSFIHLLISGTGMN